MGVRLLLRPFHIRCLVCCAVFYFATLWINNGTFENNPQVPKDPDIAKRKPMQSVKEMELGDVEIIVSDQVRKQQRFLCQMRSQAEQTIIAHLHIQKSGGTAFALALKSECVCNDKKPGRPQKGYCRQCPHVLEDMTQPPVVLTQNLWTFQNITYDPPYTRGCSRYKATGRWFGFLGRNRTDTFYSLNRLTTGWPCGVHVGYARLRMCCNRLQLRGIHHVIVTLFRDPLARYVSEFYQSTFHRRAIDSWDWCMRRPVPFSFEEYVQFPVSYPFQSRVTKMLSGSPVQIGAAGEDWTQPGVREQALERAISVMRSTEDFVFGLAERLEETLEMFQFIFRRRFEAPAPCHSHSGSSTGECNKVQLGIHDRDGRELSFSENQLKYFYSANKEDVVIYDLAKQIFKLRMEAMRSLKVLGTDFAVDEKCREILSEPEEDNPGVL